MKAKIFLKSILMWFVLVIIAIINGMFREFVITPNLGSSIGHILSTISLILLLLFATFLFLRYLNSDFSKKELISIGFLWLLLTISFEFIFGHFVMGHTWEKLFADYNILNGKIWILVLFTTFLAPVIVGSRAKRG